MEQRIQRDGMWWQKGIDGSWATWNVDAGQWERQASLPPPPPPPPPGPLALAVAGIAPASRSLALPGWATSRKTEITEGAIALVAVIVVFLTWVMTGRGSSFYARGAAVGTGTLAAAAGHGLSVLYAKLAEQRERSLFVSAVATVVAVVLALGIGFAFAPRATPRLDDAFVPLRGFAYQAVPEAQMEPAKAMLRSVPEVNQVLRDVGARAVTKKGKPMGAVVVFSVDPDELRRGMGSFLEGFRSSLDVPVRRVDLRGVPGYEVRAAAGTGVVFFDDDGLIFVVQGARRGATKRVATQLAAGNAR